MNDSDSDYSDSTDDEQSPKDKFKQQVCGCVNVLLCYLVVAAAFEAAALLALWHPLHAVRQVCSSAENS